MILLDTNVISEAIRDAPHPAVRAWLDAQAVDTLFLSTVTIAELLFGVAALPAGRRKNALAAGVEKVIALFDGRLLPFDVNAARHYAACAAQARAAGQAFPVPDGYIAAIAASLRFAVASRNMTAFKAAGLTIIDPWR